MKAAKICRKWRNWRADYGKLNRSEGKSGQEAVRKTWLQMWKLNRLAFLAPFIVRRSGQSIKMRGNADDKAIKQLQEVSSDEESGITDPSQSVIARPCCSTSSNRRTNMKKKQQKKQQPVSKVSIILTLSQLLEENRKKNTELPMKIDHSTEQPSERDTFAAWLGSVVQQVPNEQFRSFQTEVCGVSLRYLQSASMDAARTPEYVQMASAASHLQQPVRYALPYLAPQHFDFHFGYVTQQPMRQPVRQQPPMTQSLATNTSSSTDVGGHDAGDRSTVSIPGMVTARDSASDKK